MSHRTWMHHHCQWWWSRVCLYVCASWCRISLICYQQSVYQPTECHASAANYHLVKLPNEGALMRFWTAAVPVYHMWTCFCFADNIVHSVPGSTKDIYVWLGNTNTTDGRSKVTKSPAGWCQRVTVRLFPAFSVFLSLMKTCDCGGNPSLYHWCFLQGELKKTFYTK